MDLLFLNRSYWPDVEATGQLLTELCTDLASQHRVAVIAGRPNFVTANARSQLLQREVHQGVEILRVGNRTFSKRSFLGRVVGLLSYLVLATWAAFRHRRPDIIIVETDPPVLGVLGVALKRWHRRPLVYYLQDLYPEVGLVMGRLKPGLITRLLHWATQLGLEQADRVIVLGEDMQRRVLARGIDAKKIAIVPNWADASGIRPVERENALRQSWQVNGRLVVMYSGNHGLSQGLSHILIAAEALQGEPVEFVFVGEGAAKADLMAQAEAKKLTHVRFLPYQPKEHLSESLGAADVHLIPLQKGLAGFIVPSKLYGILAAGRPYIAGVDADSEVAMVTRQERCGLQIDPDNAKQWQEAILWCLANRDKLGAMGKRGRACLEAKFERSRCVAAYAEILGALTSRRQIAG